MAKNNNNNSNRVRIDNLKEDIRRLEGDIERIRKNHVSKTEYEPVRKIIYSVVSMILVAFMGAIIALVIK